MKVALVIANYDPCGGGAERWTDRHARLLLARGHEVHLFSRRFLDPPAEAVCHWIDDRWGRPLWRRFRFAARAETLLRSETFDCIHDMGEGWYADLFMPHHGTRHAVHQHNGLMWSPATRHFRRLAFWVLPRYLQFRALERQQYSTSRSSKLILALSQMVKRQIQRYHHVPTDRIRVVYNGVNTHEFRPPDDDSDRRRLRQRLGLAGRTVFALAAYNFRLKGLDATLAALGRLASRNEPVGLIVLGSGQVNRYRRMAEKLGIGPLVRFVGDQPDPRPYYHASDVYVQPSFYDSCSLVVLEALACGLPVITTSSNGAGELITPGREGFVLGCPNDVPTLAERMSHLLPTSFRERASLAARRLAEAHTIERNYEQIVDLYHEIAARRVAA